MFSVGVGNDLLQLSGMVYFEGTETAEFEVPHVISALCRVSQRKSCVLNCTAYPRAKRYVALCFTRLSHCRSNWTIWQRHRRTWVVTLWGWVGGGGVQNRTWLLWSLIYGGVKLERVGSLVRTSSWYTYTPFPHSHLNFCHLHLIN
jgi:hypothetical protein